MKCGSNIVFSLFILLLVLFLPTVVIAKPQPPYTVIVDADEVTPSGDTVIVTVSAEAWNPSMMQNTVLTLHLPKIGVLEPEKVVLWRNSGSARKINYIERVYTISGLVNGEYRVSADLSILSDESSEPSMVSAGSLYMRVCDHGIFCSSASMMTTKQIELKEDARRRGFFIKDKERLKAGAPDIYKKMKQLHGGSIPVDECLDDFSFPINDKMKKRSKIKEEMLKNLNTLVYWNEHENMRVLNESVCYYYPPGSNLLRECRQKAKQDFNTACERYKKNLSKPYYSKEDYFIKDMEKYCEAARIFKP